MAKSIVKAEWLPEPLSDLKLQSLLLQGEFRVEDFSARDRLQKGLALSYLQAKSAQIAGRPAQVFEELKGLELKSTNPLECELLFLKGFALSRLGQSQEAQRIFATLPKTYQSKVLIEKGLEKLNRGDVLTAETCFKEALEKGRGEFDPYSACTLLGGLSLAHIHQGQFGEAESCIRERRRVLSRAPSESLAFGTRLYEILLLLERNEFTKVAILLSRTLGEMERESINSYFVLHLKLRLHLARNELREAEVDLVELQKTAKALNLHEGVLDFRLEEIELLLRKNHPHEAARCIEKLKTDAVRLRDQFLRFRLSVLNAVLFIQNREADAAIAEISDALEVGESHRYRPAMTWALFHAAGIAAASGRSVQAKLFLNRGRKISREIGLKIRLACFTYMSEVLEKKYAGGSALISLAKHPEIGPELEYFLDAYRLLDVMTMTVTSAEGRESVAEPQLRRLLFKQPGLFWFQKEGVLLANTNRGEGAIALVEWTPQSPLLVAFRLLWPQLVENKPGLTLQDFHKARSPHAYRADLHESAAKMLVSRLRDKLKSSGLEIIFRREVGRYEFRTPLPAFTILSGRNEKSAPNRKEEILERIGMEPFVSTQTLCDEFKVSRQALHPFLSALQKEGKVRMVKRGPSSGYIRRT